MKSREYLIPLQALAALGLCIGMAWMVFVIAGFNPNPPTAMDLQSRSTEDVSFASMNATAAALAVNLIAEFVPTSIVLPETQISPLVPTPTFSFALIPISGASLTPTRSSFFSFLFPPTRDRGNDSLATATLIPPTATLVPTRTQTPRPTGTWTPRPTLTPEPTDTPRPTSTPTEPPTDTDTPRPTPTDTPEPPPTDTDTPEPPPTDTTEPPEPTATDPPEPTATEPDPVATSEVP